ncbi:MAG TPA: ABC transporter permease, partial [Pirellulaceae bacterium]|nr:ABC transporter permease [Pirellulaceae bacterium]
WLMAKTVVCGLGVGAIAYHLGRGPKYSTTDVSRSVTSTILWGTLFVLAVHFLFAQIEFNDLHR